MPSSIELRCRRAAGAAHAAYAARAARAAAYPAYAACAALVFVLTAAVPGRAAAQAGLDAPPPLPRSAPPSQPVRAPAGTAAAAKPDAARRVIRLPDTERSRLTAPAAASDARALTEVPPQEQLPPAHPVAPEARIDQIRQGNHVVEIRVTPAGSTRSYVIAKRDPSRPQPPQDPNSDLSAPRFFRLNF